MANPNILRVFKQFPNPLVGSTAGVMSEWFPSYSPRYPYNNTIAATDGGHLFEMDDTPGSERVQLTHRTGSHIELRPDGSVKYKSTKNRQDVTIGDQEIIVQGDFKITVDGGAKILVRNGAIEIQSEYGVAVNVAGEMKMSADNILLQATNKISLAAPFVDIGGTPTTPYMQLPFGVVPIFGVPVPVMTGLTVTKTGTMPTPSASLPSLVSAVTSIAGEINKIASYA